MSTHREIEFRKQIEALSQRDLVTILCAAVAAIDDQHLEQTLEQIGDDHLGTLVAKGIVEQRAREEQQKRDYCRICRPGQPCIMHELSSLSIESAPDRI